MLKKHLIWPVSLITTAFVAVCPAQAQFWTNQIADPVVVQIGDGSTTVNGTGYTVTLKHYINGLGSQISPSSTATFTNGASGPDRLVLSASATSEGNLTTSADRNFIVLAGYDAANATTAVNGATANANRVIGFASTAPLVGLTGSSTTAYSQTQATAYNTNNIRSAVSTGGPLSDAWTGGTGTTASTAGVRYQTATQVSNSVTNIRSVDIYNGQLYASSGSGAFVGVNAVGTGLPTTTGQTIVNLLATGAGSSPYEYVAYNDITASQTNLPTGNINRIYVADDRASASGGIQRWTWTGSAWNLDYTLNDAGIAGARGLAGYLDGSNSAVLFFTTAAGTQLRQLTDTGSGSLSFLLATADANTVFRGVALVAAVPEPATWGLIAVTVLSSTGVWYYRRRRSIQERFARLA